MLLTNLTAATMRDGYGLIEDAAILIEGGRIAWVGPRAEAPSGHDTTDCEGRVATPGLIDCHTHITGEPDDYYESVVRKSAIDTATRSHVYAGRTLRAGFTTIRNVGAGSWDDVALKEAIEAGKVDGPRIVPAGYSFGAGAAPLIVRDLPPAVRAHVKLLALVSPLAWGSLRFTPAAWIDLPPRGAQAVAPALSALKPTTVLCLYGETDRASACPSFAPGLVHAVPIGGGHHFGGDYRSVGEAILAALG